MKLKNIILGLLGISLVVTVHELGHWTMCKLFEVDTPRFSIGFGPIIAEKKIGRTIFTLSALPIGGYVEVAGMRSPEPDHETHSFITKPFSQKMLILMGGILFNMIFALLIFIFAGFPPKPLPKSSENEILEKNPEQSEKTTVVGPLGIITLIARSASYGAGIYFFFLGILSINLAIFNLFPLPILDGGQLLIYSVEAIKGSQLPESTYNTIMTITMILVLLFLFYIMGLDIKRITKTQ